jgi:hypothetical protein
MSLLMLDYECLGCQHRWRDLWHDACASSCGRCGRDDVPAISSRATTVAPVDEPLPAMIRS